MSASETASSRGFVWLVGAGPGDPELITVRGLRCLEAADAVLFDGLVHPELLSRARPGAEIIDAAKRSGCRDRSQIEINERMVTLARAGLLVCRLKGGDPCVFGRGGEEAEYLARQGIRFEIVPGVTAATAVPTAAGIPLTHRDHASYFQVITGHEDPVRTRSRVDWSGIARSRGTLVFLMGSGRLEEICGRLTSEGMDPETPVALIGRGTLPDQVVVVTTVGRGAAGPLDPGVEVPRPALFVVGSVVSLKNRPGCSPFDVDFSARRGQEREA